MASKYVNVSPIEADETEGIYIKVKVDVEDALKGLKAIQREARKATQALRELDEELDEMQQKVEEEDDESDAALRKKYVGELFYLTQEPGSPIDFKYRHINEAIYRAVFWPSTPLVKVIEKARCEGATTSIIAAARTAPDQVVVIAMTETIAQRMRETHGIEAYTLHDVDGRDFQGKTVVIDFEENLSPDGRHKIERIIRGGFKLKRLVLLRQKMDGNREVRYLPEA